MPVKQQALTQSLYSTMTPREQIALDLYEYITRHKQIGANLIPGTDGNKVRKVLV